jgi:hypothetical protein
VCGSFFDISCDYIERFHHVSTLVPDALLKAPLPLGEGLKTVVVQNPVTSGWPALAATQLLAVGLKRKQFFNFREKRK